MRRVLIAAVTAALFAVASSAPAAAGRASATPAGKPYLGAIAIDAADGRVLMEDGADVRGAPASMLKLMNLLIILEKAKGGALKLDDKVRVTAEASKIGGSQVYLAENEEFTIDEMLYALMVQSANDAATALAVHLAGSKEAFVAMMNAKARQLGMASTVFQSVHGLPPGAGQEADVTTPRDFAVLCRELVTKHPEALRYTSTREKVFRPSKPFNMQTHNNLLGVFEGCDGLKTGYYRAAGYSIAATAQRGAVRVIAVVMGSPSKTVRDSKAREMLSQGILAAAQARAAPPVPRLSASAGVGAVSLPPATPAPAAK